MSTPTTESTRRRTLWVAGGVLAVLLVLFAGIAIESRRNGHDTTSNGTRAPAAGSSSPSSPGPNGSGLLVEPAPASTDGGHLGAAGIRIGFDQSCKGAVEAATAYTEIGPLFVQYFKPSVSPSSLVAAIYATNASANDKRVAAVFLNLTPSQAAAFAKQPWSSYPSWGAFRVRNCQPATTASIDIWYCLFRTNPTHTPVTDPSSGPGRECITTSYELEWQSGDWKVKHLDGPINAPTSDDFASPDRTPLTVAQRATVVGVVPGWQEYADAPR